MKRLLLRAEARPTERRAPLSPLGAGALIGAGAEIVVERDAKRVFPDADYAAAGCALAEAGAWLDAPPGATVLGLKELPPEPAALSAHHIHFAHLYKEQRGWRDALARFARGGGRLFDLEYLVGEDGRRVAAFGWHAGWMGALLGVAGLRARDAGRAPPSDLEPFPDRGAALAWAAREGGAPPRAVVVGAPLRAVVIGALGRSGRGAVECLRACGAEVAEWDVAETRALDHDALAGFDLLVNCALTTGPGLLLATPETLDRRGRRLRMISDVACDPLSAFNPIPLYDAPTSWAAPFRAAEGAPDVAITAIDNLPSLLPLEASEDFAAQLLPALARFPDGPEWIAAARAFDEAIARAGL